jgi:hypothetical protein
MYEIAETYPVSSAVRVSASMMWLEGKKIIGIIGLNDD